MAASKSKKFAIFALALILIIGGGGAYLLYNLNNFAKPLTEKIASQTMGVDVSIASMNIDLKERKISVGGIKVANPTGYKKPYAVTINDISITLETFTKSLFTFKDISVDGTQAFLEVTPSGTNIQALQKAMANAKAQKPVKAPKQGTSTTTANPIKVIIDRIAITSAELHPTITLLSETDLNAIEISDLTLTQIGRKQNGVLAQDAIKQIMTPLLKSFSNSAQNAGFYNGLSADTLKELGTTQLNSYKDKIGKDLGIDVDNVSGALKGLFK